MFSVSLNSCDFDLGDRNNSSNLSILFSIRLANSSNGLLIFILFKYVAKDDNGYYLGGDINSINIPIFFFR